MVSFWSTSTRINLPNEFCKQTKLNNTRLSNINEALLILKNISNKILWILDLWEIFIDLEKKTPHKFLYSSLTTFLNVSCLYKRDSYDFYFRIYDFSIKTFWYQPDLFFCCDPIIDFQEFITQVFSYPYIIYDNFDCMLELHRDTISVFI